MGWPAVLAASFAVALGAAGLVRASMPLSVPAAAPAGAGAITVTGAYVVAPVAPTRIAAAYFTVYNTTARPDRLVSVETGAGATSTLHTTMPDGSMTAMSSGAEVPAHGRLVLKVGGDHVMIEHLFGTIKPGQHVQIELQFSGAGAIDVSAPVVRVGTPPPVPGGHS